jgi:hypothetical protein
MNPLWVALLFTLASLAAIVRTRERSQACVDIEPFRTTD